MDLIAIIAQLRQQLASVESSIVSFEQLALGGTRRRGRPPKWMKEAREAARAATKRPPSKATKLSPGELRSIAKWDSARPKLRGPTPKQMEQLHGPTGARVVLGRRPTRGGAH
jgi:hypothetical protein